MIVKLLCQDGVKQSVRSFEMIENVPCSTMCKINEQRIPARAEELYSRLRKEGSASCKLWRALSSDKFIGLLLEIKSLCGATIVGSPFCQLDLNGNPSC